MSDDEETVRGRSAARPMRTASAVRSAGHATSGGHALNTITSRWRHQPGDEHKRHRVADYQEFPKWVYPDSPDGSYGSSPSRKGVLVNSQTEEDTALAGLKIVRDDDERARLILLGEVKGVPIDKRWSLDRIRQTIEAAASEQGFDPSLDPSK